jgi:hypothetical protein
MKSVYTPLNVVTMGLELLQAEIGDGGRATNKANGRVKDKTLKTEVRNEPETAP